MNAFVEKAGELGLEIVATEAFATGDKDYKAQITNIAAKGIKYDLFFITLNIKFYIYYFMYKFLSLHTACNICSPQNKLLI